MRPRNELLESLDRRWRRRNESAHFLRRKQLTERARVGSSQLAQRDALSLQHREEAAPVRRATRSIRDRFQAVRGDVSCFGMNHRPPPFSTVTFCEEVPQIKLSSASEPQMMLSSAAIPQMMLSTSAVPQMMLSPS